MLQHIPHPANVPGDFYVEDGCCTMCEVPFSEAPDLFGTIQDPKGYPHCYVKRQPESPAELDQMVNAIRCAELQCIRYRGSNRLIQLRLVSEGEGVVCDGLPPDLQAESDRREARRQTLRQEYQQVQRASSGEQPVPRRPWWRFWW